MNLLSVDTQNRYKSIICFMVGILQCYYHAWLHFLSTPPQVISKSWGQVGKLQFSYRLRGLNLCAFHVVAQHWNWKSTEHIWILYTMDKRKHLMPGTPKNDSRHLRDIGIGTHLLTRAESAEPSPSIIGCSLVIITQGAIGCIDNDLLDAAPQGWKFQNPLWYKGSLSSTFATTSRVKGRITRSLYVESINCCILRSSP